MSKLSTVWGIYEEEGLESVFKKTGEHIFGDSHLSPYLSAALGERIHQKIYMYFRLGYWPQIKEPRTYNEKILHRKLYSDNDLFARVEDKWRVRDYVADKVGNEILPEVYHVTKDPETIPFERLPDKYVIKPTHMSGPVIFVEGNEEPDPTSIKRSCREWLDTNYGAVKGEYWYSQIEPRILVEEWLDDGDYYLPRDFKFYVFHGNVKAIGAYQKKNKNDKKRLNYYTPNWEEIVDLKKGYERGDSVSRPRNLDDMVEIAESLGADFDHIRVDLYSLSDERVVFGELTVAEGSGGNPFEPQKYDFEFGSYW